MKTDVSIRLIKCFRLSQHLDVDNLEGRYTAEPVVLDHHAGLLKLQSNPL